MYYRVTANKFNGYTHKTDIVLIKNNIEIKTLSIFPNPITNNRFAVYLNNNTPGKFKLSLYSLNGEILYKTSFDLPFKRTSKIIQLPATIGAGSYMVKIGNEAGEINSFKLINY